MIFFPNIGGNYKKSYNYLLISLNKKIAPFETKSGNKLKMCFDIAIPAISVEQIISQEWFL